METMKQSGLWSSLGTHGSLVVIWCLCISGSNGIRNFDFFLRSIALQNYKNLNQCILHLWSQFGDPSLNGWWVMVRSSSKWANLGFDLKFDLEGHGRSLHKTAGTLTKLFCIIGIDMVILASTNGCVNNRNAGDLRRHHAHYDVTVMIVKPHISPSQLSLDRDSP